MKAFLYATALQFKLDIRSRSMLITCYLVPLIFFAFMGGIFTSINPQSAANLIPTMTIFTVSMGALIGLPSSLVEIFSGDIKKGYQANGIPLFLCVLIHLISSFIHLSIMSSIILIIAPYAFNAVIPENLGLYFGMLFLFISTSLSVGCILGLLCKSESKLTMIAQVIFLPSIMLSGIMFPASMLPEFLQYVAYIFPATISFLSMTAFQLWHIFPLLGILVLMLGLAALLTHKIGKKR